MTRTTGLSRLFGLLLVTCALVASVGAASAFALSPTPSPLSGSDFQGGDGDQANPATPGVVDWQAIAGTLPDGTDDPIGGDIAFGGGNKETEPINWDTQNEGSGVNPNKDNIIAAWSAARPGVNGSTHTFLNLAFTREASTGNTFATFELNQGGGGWNNGNGQITCRKTNDLLISYEVASGGTPPNVDIVVYKWTSVTLDPNGSGCGATGTLTPLDPQPYAEGAVNATGITNYISGTLANPNLGAGTFGEASLDLTGILNKLGLSPCENFAQVTMHTRSSTSIDSQLQDLGRTIPVPIAPCKLKIDKQVSVGNTSHFDDGPQVGYVGQTAYYKLIVSNTGSQPLDVTTTDIGPTCSGDLFTTPNPGVGDSPVSMPEAIAAGASKTYYCSHVITSGDATAGHYTNKACTSGTNTSMVGVPPHPVTVTAPGDPNAAALCDTATVTVNDPHMAIDKKQALDDSGNNWTDGALAAHVGDVVYYEIVASNTGNTPIDVTATDVKCADTVYTSIDQQTVATFPDQIAAGDDAVYYCRHTLTSADAAANGGDFVNTACITATDTATPPADATDANGDTETCDSVTTHVVVPGLAIVKEVSGSGAAGDFHDSIALKVGDTAYYRIVVTNTGTVHADLTNVDISEKVAVCDAGTIVAPAGFTLSGGKLSGNLAQGASVTVTCTHLVQETDGGQIDNIACAKGMDMTGSVLGAGDSICDNARVTVPFIPGSVSGSKYEDTNSNGVRDAGEGPLAGVTIYVDYNGNGQLDQGEPTGVSDASGQWSIGGINAGTFNVLEVPVAGYTCTEPATTCAYNLTFKSGTAHSGKVFGNAPPAQILLPARVTPGTARLLGPTGCAARAFSARIRGTKVQTVTFVLDGKTFKRFTRTNKSGLYAVRINPAKLALGVHRLVVSVTFQKGSGTKPKTMRLSFQRCGKKLVTPRFTG
jgi:uncharacterized repeat protein (TIGR01451 family)